MSYIEFIPSGALYSLEVATHDSLSESSERIHMPVTAQLKWRDTLVLEDGTSMKGVAWNFGAKRRKPENQDLGYIHSLPPFEDPDGEHSRGEKYFVEVELTDREFDSLLASVRHYTEPPVIIVGVKGLDFGLDPNGHDLIWNNRSSPDLPITMIEFRWPMSDYPPPKDGEYEENIASTVDASTAQMTAQEFQQASLGIRKSLRTITWVLIGIVIAVVVF